MTTFIKLSSRNHMINIDNYRRPIAEKLEIKIKIIMFKMDKLTLGIDLRVASLFIKYITAKGIIPESLKSKSKFYHA